MQSTDFQTFTLPSKLESVQKVEEIIDNLYDSFNLTKDCYGNILIAITEAINNAIIHGNKKELTKFVQLQIAIKTEFLYFTIKDEGCGFDYNDIPDPTLPDNLCKESGRGVFLMRNLADKVIFENNGSTIILIFCIS